MSDIITTLHKKGDNTINVYPNIKNENIPSASITGDKLANGSVGTNQLVANAVTSAKIASSAVTASKIATGAVSNTKIEDGAVTTAKLANGSVSNSKLASNAVSTSNIINEAITYGKLESNLKNLILRVQRTYNFFIGDSDDNVLLNGGTFTASSYMLEFLTSEINSAFDFDKAQADYTTTDLQILTEFVNGITNKGFDASIPYKCEVRSNDYTFYISVISSTQYVIELTYNGSTQFYLEWNPQTYTITSYTNTKYIYIYLHKLINESIL